MREETIMLGMDRAPRMAFFPKVAQDDGSCGDWLFSCGGVCAMEFSASCEVCSGNDVAGEGGGWEGEDRSVENDDCGAGAATERLLWREITGLSGTIPSLSSTLSLTSTDEVGREVGDATEGGVERDGCTSS